VTVKEFLPITNYQLPITNYQLPITNYQSPITNHQSPIPNHQLPITNFMRLQEEPDLPAQINIVPMIDVIFAILTFFIMSTLFLTRSEGLPVNLPQAVTAKSQAAAEPITVTVDQDGKISLNSQPVSLNSLGEKVQELKGNNLEVLVIINADANATHGQVVGVMDRVRQVEGAKLAIATQKP
jgi:biopolymer transport protein ExbD